MKQAVTFDRFFKIDEKTSPELISKETLSSSENIVLDRSGLLGKPRKRGGWKRYDANGHSEAKDILTLNDVNANGTMRVIASAGTKIQSLDKGTGWDDWVTGLTDGHKHRMATYKDKFLFVFDTDDVPVMADNDLSTSWDLEMSEVVNSQVKAIESFHDNGGNLTQKTLYKWIIVGQTADGQLTPPSRPFTHFYHSNRSLTTDDDTSSTKICFTELPYIPDTRVVSRLIFRTKSTNYIGGDSNYSTGEVYYKVTTLDNDASGSEYQTEWEDNIADGDLGTDIVIYMNMPTRAKYIAVHKDRIFFANFTQVNRQFISPPSSNVEGSPTVPTQYSGYATGDAGYMIDITPGFGGTLLDNEVYEYRIHWVDSSNRLSRYYHDLTVTTNGGTGSNDRTIPIIGLGTVDDLTMLEISRVKVFRRTGGGGDYYLIADVDIQGDRDDGSTYKYTRLGRFTDYGAADLTETWSDPDENTEGHASRIIFSNIEAPSEVQEENYAEAFPEDGDAITGIYDDIDGVLIVKERSICKLYTSGSPTNWRVVKLVENIGCTDPETLQKRGKTYYFVSNGVPYRYIPGMAEPEQIGVSFQDSFDLITTWHDSTVTEEWYMIAGNDASSDYYILIYDIKLQTWYRFTTDECKSLHTIKFGSDANTIIGNNDQYVTEYDESETTDTETGSGADISTKVWTKNLTFPDSITRARLRKIKFAYTKVSGKDTTIALSGESVSYTYTDNTGSGGKVYEKDVSTTGVNSSVMVKISGAGMQQFNSFRLEYRPVKRGRAIDN